MCVHTWGIGPWCFCICMTYAHAPDVKQIGLTLKVWHGSVSIGYTWSIVES